MKRFRPMLVVLVAGCAGHATPYAPIPTGLSEETRAGLARLRAATDRFHSIDSAVAAGYPAVSPQCYVEPDSGAMGYHHVNRAIVDRTLEPEHPEILLYERTREGRYNLTAVEFLVPYRLWPKDSTAPQVMGMPLGHVDELSTWGLHMWIWKANPTGMFAWWNPDIRWSENLRAAKRMCSRLMQPLISSCI